MVTPMMRIILMIIPLVWIILVMIIPLMWIILVMIIPLMTILIQMTILRMITIPTMPVIPTIMTTHKMTLPWNLPQTTQKRIPPRFNQKPRQSTPYKINQMIQNTHCHENDPTPQKNIAANAYP